MLNCISEQVSVDEKSSPTIFRIKSREEIIFRSGWGKVVKLVDLIRAKVIEESRVLELERQEVSTATTACIGICLKPLQQNK